MVVFYSVRTSVIVRIVKSGIFLCPMLTANIYSGIFCVNFIYPLSE